ncbi:hypothetical protein [Methanonatronarchaeum thermophilum]|nr:hypothetical protein [Methanonatronarchaeum thermophilum]
MFDEIKSMFWGFAVSIAGIIVVLLAFLIGVTGGYVYPDSLGMYIAWLIAIIVALLGAILFYSGRKIMNR